MDIKRNWLHVLIGLLITNIQTVGYHLPLNLDFVNQSIELTEVDRKLNTWRIFHWIRIVVVILSGVYIMRVCKSMIENK